MNDDIQSSAEYAELLESIKQTLASARSRAARAVNNVIIETYWEIGYDIDQRRKVQGWGARVIERLSADLRTAHPGMRGLSPRNLEYMATLAARWPGGIAQQAAARLPWGQLMVLLDTCANPLTCEFYAQRAADEGWSRGMLQAMIASRLHERTQPALTTFDRSLPEADCGAIREIIKDPYILDFLTEDALPERDFHKALIATRRELAAGSAVG